VNRKNVSDVLSGVLESGSHKSPPVQLAQKLVAVATELGDENNLVRILVLITKRHSDHYQPWQMAALAGVLEVCSPPASLAKLGPMLAECRTLAADPKAQEPDRIAALEILGRQADRFDADLKLLSELLAPQNSA